MHRKPTFAAAPLLLSLAAPSLLLGGCAAGPAGDYPSLAIRDAERITGTLSVPQPYVGAPPSAAILGQLDALESEADAAHAAFLAEAPRASSIVSAARGAEIGSEAWANAEVALASLTTARSRTMVALADLDRLYVSAAVEGGALDAIASVRDEVQAQVAAENATIAALKDVLAR